MASKFSGFFRRFGAVPPAAPPTPPQPTTPGPPIHGSNLDQARELKQQGRLGEAAALCRQALATRPLDVEASILLAELCVAQGDRDEAIALYSELIVLRPDQPLAYYKRGNLLKDRGRLEAALADYDRAITLDPGYAYALCNRGVVLSRLNRLEAALDSYDRATAAAPDDALAFFNRADVLRELKRSDEALASYDRAIAIKADYLESHCNRGVLLTEIGRYTEALASFERALGINAGFPDAYYGRGRLLQKLKRIGESLADFEHAAKLNPHFAAAYCGHGGVLIDLERWGEALTSFDKALTVKPDYADAHNSRGYALLNLKRYAEAIQAYERALACKPDIPFTHGQHCHVKMQVCDWDGLEANVERIAAGVHRGESASPPFPFLSMVDDASLHHEAAQIWVREECCAKDDLPALPERAAPGKLRIGYFSGDFCDHPVAVLTAELFESHDRSHFEITAFSLGPNRPSPMRSRLEKAFDRFVDARDRSDRDLTLLSRNYEIDIAVDLSGHTNGSRPAIFAQRAAPLQVAYLGYPGTMGCEHFDYLIGDPTVIPPEHQPHYSEKILYLPHSLLPNDSTRAIDARPTREQAGLPPAGVVFCCFNNSYKLTPGVFSSWMRILARVAGSVLWLSQNNALAASNLRREAERRGLDPRRLIFAERTPSLSQHLARLQLADLFLDTLPYNAHTTAIDALWVGLPLLTRIGQAFPGRVAASLLRSIGLPELVTTTMQQYEDLAVELAMNPPRLAEIRLRLAHNRLTTPLFDSRSFVRHLESAYTMIFERYRAGLPPDHIYVERNAN
jgi:protein O-GlcNAc transferase